MVNGPTIIYPKWQPQLQAALAETDPDKCLERVEDAERVVAKRLESISRSTSHTGELEAIEDAMDVLELLRRKANRQKAS